MEHTLQDYIGFRRSEDSNYRASIAVSEFLDSMWRSRLDDDSEYLPLCSVTPYETQVAYIAFLLDVLDYATKDYHRLKDYLNSIPEETRKVFFTLNEIQRLQQLKAAFSQEYQYATGEVEDFINRDFTADEESRLRFYRWVRERRKIES